MHAPLAFALAAGLTALSAASFAELAGRFPVAAGEAAYARVAFQSDRIATAVGLLVVAIAITSAAAISVGSAGYLAVFVPLPAPLLIVAVVLAMGAIAAWGVKESVTFAATMTVIEIGGLLVLILAGFALKTEIVTRMPEIVAVDASPVVLAGLMSATLLAVFAFVGFEGLANVAEEVREPERNLPRAIFLTLTVSTLLYVLVVWISLVTVERSELAQSTAPLALVFARLTGASAGTMSLIALVATLNGIIVQIIMASRVLYGLARQGGLPAAFGHVSQTTRTPMFATMLTSALVFLLALMLPLHHLADVTSRLTLIVFAVVNISLVRIKQRGPRRPPGIYVAPTWVPWAGAVACIALLSADLLALWLWR
jgi:amino acid transporter